MQQSLTINVLEKAFAIIRMIQNSYSYHLPPQKQKHIKL